MKIQEYWQAMVRVTRGMEAVGPAPWRMMRRTRGLLKGPAMSKLHAHGPTPDHRPLIARKAL